MLLHLVLLLALAGTVSWFLLYTWIPHLRRVLVDQPNARSSHRIPTPRGGGVAFVSVAVVATVIGLAVLRLSPREWSAAVLPLAALPLAFVGFMDDRHNLPASWRYGVQLATALVLILLSPLPLPWLAMPLLLFAVTAVINFTNFMDGLDGLVAGCMAITFAAACLQRSTLWPFWALVGALLGFLLWNWSPAKVFMGDVGSTFLGAVFAGLVLQACSWPEALALLLVVTPLLADACICVARRLMASQPVFEAHRLHLFQRLHQAGWSHARVASLYIAATAALSVALLCGGLAWVLGLAAVELLVGVGLDQRVAVSFAVASRAPLVPPAVLGE
jgi:Fuc2NAc and GlcNAc transferase